jgi:hypothetical protein
VVGQAIARNAWPARIGRDGTVHANAADSIWAFELTQRSADIARRLGVAAIRFAPGPLADPAEAAAAPTVPLPSPDQVRAAGEIAAAIASQELRDAVAKAVGLSLARAASDRPV